MASRKRIMSTCVAVVATLMFSVPFLSSAQPGRDAPPEYTPAPDAKDLKSVLFNWAWYTGMLRSTEERDLIMTLVYEGKGTIQVTDSPAM